MNSIFIFRSHLLSVFLFILSLVVISGCKSDEEPEVVMHSVISLDPVKGFVGENVNITGINLDLDPSATMVTFNGVSAPVLSIEEERISTSVPANATTGPVSVSISGRMVDGPVFEVLEPPVILSFSPDSVVAGEEVVVLGENFSEVKEKNILRIADGEPFLPTSSTSSRISFIVPDFSKTGNISVTTLESSVISDDQLVVLKDIPRDGLVFCAPFNGNDQNIITGINSTFNNSSYEADRFGLNRKSLILDGSDDYLHYDHEFFKVMNPYTISVWFRTDELTDWGHILHNTGYKILTNDQREVSMLMCGQHAEGGVSCAGERERIYKEWVNVTMSYDYEFLRWYVNGVLLETRKMSTVHFPTVLQRGLFVGSTYYETNYFHGQIDDILIYDRILTDEEVVQVFEQTITARSY